MNTIRKTFLFKMIIPIIISLTVLLLVGSPAYAEHDPLKDLGGPAFTDSSLIYEMDTEWKKQPIKYIPSDSNADIVITLDQHLYPALLPFIQDYAKENDLKISVREGTCGITAGMLSNKTGDIGGYCCPPGKIDRLPGLKFHTVGISPLALLVHPDNPVKNISIEEARQVFAGDIYNWSEMKTPSGSKGPNMSVQPVGRLHCKLRPGHWRLMLDNQDLFSTSLQEVGAIPDMISKVASNKMSIGYVVIWNITRYKDRGAVRALNINGFSPYDLEHLISGNYPIYRSYYITTWEGKNVENPKAQQLVDHLLKQSEKLGKEHYIVPASRLKQAGWKFKGNELIGEVN